MFGASLVCNPQQLSCDTAPHDQVKGPVAK